MTEGRPRRILHVDMDAFYASVEQRDDPALRGRPVAVGGDPRSRGVVCASSYEARAFGVRSALPMARAVSLCPQLVIVRPDFAKYGAVSRQVFEIFRSVTPLVEPLSLDEAYLDVTENAWELALGMDVARRLKERIREETSLTASAGVAPNKFLAKIASGWKKPDGLTVIAPERVERFLQKLPVDALWGVGPVTARKLRAAGIERLVDVRTADPESLKSAVGSYAETLRRMSFGDDPRAVNPNTERKSIGCENTFAEDLTDIETVRREVHALALHTAGATRRILRPARPRRSRRERPRSWRRRPPGAAPSDCSASRRTACWRPTRRKPRRVPDTTTSSPFRSVSRTCQPIGRGEENKEDPWAGSTGHESFSEGSWQGVVAGIGDGRKRF